jgi:hypothetical protein
MLADLMSPAVLMGGIICPLLHRAIMHARHLLVLTWTCLSFLSCDVSHFISVYRTSCLV